jgi:hypothetical protein
MGRCYVHSWFKNVVCPYLFGKHALYTWQNFTGSGQIWQPDFSSHVYNQLVFFQDVHSTKQVQSFTTTASCVYNSRSRVLHKLLVVQLSKKLYYTGTDSSTTTNNSTNSVLSRHSPRYGDKVHYSVHNSITMVPILSNTQSVLYAVLQLVEALRYKPECRRFDYRWGLWNFSLTT